MQLGILAAR